MFIKALKFGCVLMVLVVVLCFFGCGSKTNNDSSKANSSSSLLSVSEHEHSFKPSDCENPQICDCGATRGEPVGHSWNKATCTTPKTCFVCEKTEGEALGHHFVDGICTVCLEYDSETIVDSPNVWLTSDGKYHSFSAGCFEPGEEKIKSTMSKARREGYHACTKCYVIN